MIRVVDYKNLSSQVGFEKKYMPPQKTVKSEQIKKVALVALKVLGALAGIALVGAAIFGTALALGPVVIASPVVGWVLGGAVAIGVIAMKIDGHRQRSSGWEEDATYWSSQRRARERADWD